MGLLKIKHYHHHQQHLHLYSVSFVDVSLTSQYHLPDVTAIVPKAPPTPPPVLSPKTVPPSVIALVVYLKLTIELSVQKLLVGVSVEWSAAVKLLSEKLLPLPLLSFPEEDVSSNFK